MNQFLASQLSKESTRKFLSVTERSTPFSANLSRETQRKDRLERDEQRKREGESSHGSKMGPFPIRGERIRKTVMPNVKVGLEETDDEQNPPNGQGAPCGANRPISVFLRSFCPEMAKSRSDRSPSVGRAEVFCWRGSGSQLRGYNYDRQGRRKAAPTTPAKARRGRKVNNFPFSGGVTTREL